MALVHTEFIGRYRVVGTLGQGSMGRVYLADDPGLGIKVAIKFIKRDNMLENEVILARFRREAALGARTRHPNIVAIYDVGQDANHGPYLVMEYVDGRELLEILREGTASIAEKLDWLQQAAKALRCAHEGGIIHRDVKPANILVSRSGQAKLIDFGVAKVMGGPLAARSTDPEPEADLLADKHATAWGLLSVTGSQGSDEPHLEVLTSHGSQESQVTPEGQEQEPDFAAEDHQSDGLTQVGALIGTPSYTAPELMTGANPSPQTDDFAFAVTAYQTLLAQLPFKGRGTRDTLEKIRDAEIEFPAGVDLKLRRVFLRALAKQPRDRYPDLEAFMQDLYAAHGMQPATQAPTPMPATSRPLSRASLSALPPLKTRVRWLAWIGGGLALLVLASLGLNGWLASRSGLEELTVHTDPTGASVYVDGQYLGQSPLDRVTLPAAGRRLRVLKKHYRSVERSLTPEDGFISLVMELAPYNLKVETDPSGAEILLDGHPAGVSPTVLKRVPGKGEHILQLHVQGFTTKLIKLDPLRPPRGPITLDPESSLVP